ncbi:fimbrial protein [Edwardsiella tarda]|uniref:fimbrial protein n=1 Tax=Edwardsiella tarda TaxID=636 RepID=UPI0011B213DD|nr:fimbrial protein [Edwardsiella tarda]UCQ27280.1 fimbrial protein [Edwardsiella tarda]
MKKIIIATAVALTMGSGAAMAVQQADVQFFGNVSAITCDLVPEIGGNVSNLVQLGTVAPNTTGTVPVEFALKAADPADSVCAGLTAAQTASIAWSGPFDGQGLKNQGGAADGAVALLKTVNAKTTPSQPIIAGSNAVDFEANKAVSSDGFKFSAVLKGGATPGDFKSAAAYAVTYQ